MPPAAVHSFCFGGGAAGPDVRLPLISHFPSLIHHQSLDLIQSPMRQQMINTTEDILIHLATQPDIQAAAEALDHPCVVTSPEGEVLSWNSSAAALFGAFGELAAGQSFQTCLKPETHADFQVLRESIRDKSLPLSRATLALITASGICHAQTWVTAASGADTPSLIWLLDLAGESAPALSWGGSCAEGLDSLPAGVMVTDVQGRFVYANLEARRLLGIEQSEDLTGRKASDTFLSARNLQGRPVEAADLPVARALAGEGVHSADLLIDRPDHKTATLCVSAAPLLDSRGAVSGATVSLCDISTRVKTDERLQQSLDTLRAIIEASPLPILTLNTRGHVMMWNPAAEKLFGWPEGEVLGQALPVISEEQANSLRSQLMRKTGEASLTENEIRCRRRDGSTLEVGFQAAPLHGPTGRPWGLLVIGQDITGTNRANKALQESHRILRAVMDNIPDGVLIAEAPDMRIALRSRYAEDALGWSGDQLAGHSPDIHADLWSIYHADGETHARPDELPLVRAAQHGELVTNEEWVMKSAQGVPATILINAAPIRDDEGHLTGGISVWRDISEIKEAQRVLEERYERERHIADVLQTALIPEVRLQTPSYDIAGRYHPAWEESAIGGDLYDTFTLPGGRIAVAIGDVSGKGLHAAVYTAMVKYTLRAYALEAPSPASVLKRLNHAMCAYVEPGTFVTLFYGILDPRDHTLTYSSAGHEPALLIAAPHGEVREEKIGGIALGVAPDAYYSETVRFVPASGTMLLYSDGITEAGAKGGEFLGREGLVTLCREYGRMELGEMLDAIYKAAQKHAGGRLHDDAVLLGIRRLS